MEPDKNPLVTSGPNFPDALGGCWMSSNYHIGDSVVGLFAERLTYLFRKKHHAMGGIYHSTEPRKKDPRILSMSHPGCLVGIPISWDIS